MTRGRRTSHRQSGPRTRALQSQHSSERMASDPLFWLFPVAFTLFCTFDNFHVALLDAYKAQQELVTGAIELVICVYYVIVKLYEFPEDRLTSLVRTLKSLIKFPIWPANIRIYRDTAFTVIISYVLLLDISLSYIWLFIFPAIAIAFIYALCIELCPQGKGGELADDSGGSCTTTEGSSEKALKAMAAVPFCALLVMAQLEDHAADRFVISQFLLFLSSMLGALTRMMMRLSAGASPGVAPASELLHKAFLLLLLVTAHTVAAELLGEDVVLIICMLEVVPVLLWFSVHLDRDSSIISVDKMKPHRNALMVLGAVVVGYLATSMDESGLSRCTAILVSCAVSGLLTFYLVFMLRQWPGQQAAGTGNDHVAATDISLQSKKKGGKGKGDTASSEEAVQSGEQAAGSSEEVVQLLKLWANALLIVAAAMLMLLLKYYYVVARRLGLQEALVIVDRLAKGLFGA